MNEVQGENNAEDDGNGRRIMSLQGQLRRYLFMLGGSETSRTSSSSLDEAFGSENNDNEGKGDNDLSANADDVETPTTIPLSHIISNTTKGDLILIDHDNSSNAGRREADNDEDDGGSASDDGCSSSSSSSETSQEIRKSNLQRYKQNRSSAGDGVTMNGNEQHDGKNVASHTCAICLCEYQHGEEICWSSNTKCYHVFHKSCIHQWLLQHDECPYCRKAYLVDDDDDDEKERIQSRHDRDSDNDGHAPPTSFSSY